MLRAWYTLSQGSHWCPSGQVAPRIETISAVPFEFRVDAWLLLLGLGLLYRVVDAAYEKRSIALSSNLHPAGFDELMPKTIANATVDRLMHHAHVVLTAGDSIRLTQATAGKGATPLA
jgi:hypothetical protein